MGEKLQNLKPREAKGLLHALRGPPREAKPYTRMAKWEIRFQRFAISTSCVKATNSNSRKTHASSFI
jgi:hypothetical protein